MADQPLCPGMAWSTLWFFCILLLGLPVAWMVAIFYVLLIPWGACFTVIKDFCDTHLLGIIRFPMVMAQRMIQMKPFPCCDKGPGGEGGDAEMGTATTTTTTTRAVTVTSGPGQVAVVTVSHGENNAGYHSDTKRSSSVGSSSSDDDDKGRNYGNAI